MSGVEEGEFRIRNVIINIMKVITTILLIFCMTNLSFSQVTSLESALSDPLNVNHLKLNIKNNLEGLDDILKLSELQVLEINVDDGLEINLPERLYDLKKLNNISLQGVRLQFDVALCPYLIIKSPELFPSPLGANQLSGH